jgi:acetate kinase
LSEKILTINAGSSNLKFALFKFTATGAVSPISRGKIETSQCHSAAHFSNDARPGAPHWLTTEKSDREGSIDDLINWADGYKGSLIAIGHRVVHGGTAFTGPALVSEQVLEQLDQLSPLAPLHQPSNLSAIRAAMLVRPGIPQVACFDTAFHRGRAKVKTRFALPREYENAGIERYGFHGLSYEYIAEALRSIAPEVAYARVIVAHLGSGASLCALHYGKSIDTTMSFTPLDGVPMATRCGAIDPGVLLYLMRKRGMGAADVEDLLYNRAGLLGVSGLSGDMRFLLSSNEPSAIEAIELFCFRVAREIGALTTSLGGLDGLVFTAGIGERAPQIRHQICAQIEWLGISIDSDANGRGPGQISSANSRVGVWAIPTDEEMMIAKHTLAVVRNEN